MPKQNIFSDVICVQEETLSVAVFNTRFAIPKSDPRSTIRDPKAAIRDPRSAIRDPNVFQLPNFLANPGPDA